MEERAAFITSGTAELKRRLADFINDKPAVTGRFRGEKQQAKDIAWLSDDDDSAELIEKWLAKGKGPKLCEMWSKGVAINWHKLYKDKHPKRISVPVYPFAKEPYWPKKAEKNTSAAHTGVSVLHPLVRAKYVRFGRSAVQLTVYRLRIFPEGSCGQGKSGVAGSGIFGNVL